MIIRKVAAFIALSVNVVVSSSVHFLRFDFCPFQTSIRRKLLFRSEVDRPTPCGSAHRHTSNHHSPFTISTRPTSRLHLARMLALCAVECPFFRVIPPLHKKDARVSGRTCISSAPNPFRLLRSTRPPGHIHTAVRRVVGGWRPRPAAAAVLFTAARSGGWKGSKIIAELTVRPRPVTSLPSLIVGRRVIWTRPLLLHCEIVAPEH